MLTVYLLSMTPFIAMLRKRSNIGVGVGIHFRRNIIISLPILQCSRVTRTYIRIFHGCYIAIIIIIAIIIAGVTYLASAQITVKSW